MTRADLAVVVLAAALIGALYARWWTPSAAADAFELRAAGRDLGRHSLQHDQELRIAGAAGVSVIRVQAGRVRFAASPCRNRVCVNSGWLSQAGDGAACLPNRVSLVLVGGDASRVDAVSW